MLRGILHHQGPRHRQCQTRLLHSQASFRLHRRTDHHHCSRHQGGFRHRFLEPLQLPQKRVAFENFQILFSESDQLTEVRHR